MRTALGTLLTGVLGFSCRVLVAGFGNQKFILPCPAAPRAVGLSSGYDLLAWALRVRQLWRLGLKRRRDQLGGSGLKILKSVDFGSTQSCCAG